MNERIMNLRMKIEEVLARPIGMVFLAIAILIEKFLPANNVLDFIEGLLMGLSVILNIYYCGILYQKNEKKKYASN
jgi:Ca2+/Na+ antiporter